MITIVDNTLYVGQAHSYTLAQCAFLFSLSGGPLFFLQLFNPYSPDNSTCIKDRNRTWMETWY